MSYNKTNWFVGDVITADKLNNIEDYLEQISDSQESDTDVTIEIDDTLSQEGAAADAKATGDALNEKVDKVSGKDLSEENFTTTLKTKLENFENYYGSPLTASAVSGMTDTTRVYVYTGQQNGYTFGNWYYWNGSAWTSGGVYNSVALSTDSTLSVEGAAADAKTVGDAIDEIEPGLSDEAKTALLACFQHVAWVDEHGQSYYNALESALYEEVPATLWSIAATFNQGSAIIYTDTALNDLKQYLTVTARYSDRTSHTVTGYILSGTLQEGTSTITVTYDGKSTSFTIENVIDFYNIWEWSSQNTNYSALTRTPTAAFEKVIDGQKLGIQYAVGMIPENVLRGFAVSKGKCKMRNPQDGSEIDFYPIPIPATATKLTATITPSSQLLAVYVFKYTENSNADGYNYEFVAPAQIGYVTGQYVLNFTSDSDLFLTFNCKPADGNYSTNPEPEMHILFE